MLSVQPNFCSKAFTFAKAKNNQQNYSQRVSFSGMTDSVSFKGNLGRKFSNPEKSIMDDIGKRLIEMFPLQTTIIKDGLKMTKKTNDEATRVFAVEPIQQVITDGQIYNVKLFNPTKNADYENYINLTNEHQNGYHIELDSDNSSILNFFKIQKGRKVNVPAEIDENLVSKTFEVLEGTGPKKILSSESEFCAC